MFAIRAGQLIDGHSGAPRQDMLVVIDGERIAQVGTSEAVRLPEGVEIVDAGGHTVLPGLIDAHVHVHSPGGTIQENNYLLSQVTQTQGNMALRASAYARKALEMGFTTLRSLSSPAYVDVALRDAIDQGYVEGPRLKVSGQGLTITGGHMDSRLWSPDVAIAGRTGVCDGPWECRKAAREQIKRGVDLIKINAAVSRYSLDYAHVKPYHQEMTYEEMAAICEEAHWDGKRVAAHAHGGQGITDAIRAGLDSVEHAPWLDDEQVEMMAVKSVFYVPTLLVHTVLKEMGQPNIGMPDAAWNWLLKVCDDRWVSLERARKAGVKIAAGTDAGFFVRHGENAGELVDLVNGGFSPMEAIVAATRTAAECLDMQREVGTLEVGKYADLVIVDGDPLAEIGVLQDKTRIRQVFKSGRQVAGSKVVG